MSVIGDNNPPNMTVTAAETASALNEWLKEHPVIETEDDAREAKVYIDRGKLCIKDLEDERDGKVRPLNEKVKEINTYYKSPRETLIAVVEVVSSRIAAFIRSEEQKRIAAANAARRIAEEAERVAREAERIEQDAIGAANSGELGVDIQDAVVAADDAFRDYQKASRQAALAERETKVKIGGGFTRALSLKTETTLIVTDAVAAIQAMGDSVYIIEAIIKAARAYKKLHNKYPPGIEIQTERKV